MTGVTSARNCYLAVSVLALAGVAISAYLTVAYYSGAAPACGGVGDCYTVLESKYASLYGVPLSVFGLAFYAGLLIGGLAAVGLDVVPAPLRRALLAMAVGGVAMSLYLTAIELFVVDAICPYCVASGVIIVVTLVMACFGEVLSRRWEQSEPNFEPT